MALAGVLTEHAGESRRARSRPRCSGTRMSARSRPSSSRAPRAIAWNGSSRSSATPASNRNSSRTVCSPAASGSVTTISKSATHGTSRASSNGLRRAAGSASRASHVHAVHGPRRDAQESRRRLPHGDVQRSRRHAERLPSRPLRCPRPGRRRDGLHGDDLRLARRPHHARLPRSLERPATPRLDAHRRRHPRAVGRPRRAAARPRRTQRVHPSRLGRRGPATGGGQLAARIGVADPVYRGTIADAARGDARRPGSDTSRLRRRHAPRDRRGLRLARAPLRPRLPALELHLPAHEPPHRCLRRLARTIAAGFRWRSSAPCARCGPRTSR